MVAWAIPDLLPRKRIVTAVLWGICGLLLVLSAFGARLQVAHWKDSVSLMARAILVTGPNALAHNNLGMALLSQGKQDEAESHFEESVRIHPEYADALTNLGSIRCRKGFIGEGIELHKKALRIKPKEPRIYNNLGVGLASKGMTRDAVLCYQEAIRIRLDFAEAWNNLGRSYQDLGDLDGAIHCFRRALTLQPGYVTALTNLGDALLKKGQVSDAETAYQQAIERSPQAAAPAYNALATIYGARGEYKEAIEVRNKALALEPDNGATHYFLAVEHYFAGHPELAVIHCERAKALGFRGVEPEFIERLKSAGAKSPTGER
jgi:tetratricopeptide (TPR) repeat protein